MARDDETDTDVYVMSVLKMSMGTHDLMGIYSIRVPIWSETSTHEYTNGANPSPIGYAGMGTF